MAAMTKAESAQLNYAGYFEDDYFGDRPDFNVRVENLVLAQTQLLFSINEKLEKLVAHQEGVRIIYNP